MWSCGAAGRGVFSLVTDMHRVLTRLGEDVVGWKCSLAAWWDIERDNSMLLYIVATIQPYSHFC